MIMKPVYVIYVYLNSIYRKHNINIITIKNYLLLHHIIFIREIN